jgi:NADH-ubiquinone oxidoreductase chain 1
MKKYGPGLVISNYNLGILFMLAVSSLATYGILLAGLFQHLSSSIVLGTIRLSNELDKVQNLLLNLLEVICLFCFSLNRYKLFFIFVLK